MIGLQRTHHRLLRQVGGQRHATDADHFDEGGLPTPPASNGTRGSGAKSDAGALVGNTHEDEDLERDPVSSDEDVNLVSDLQMLSRMVDPVTKTEKGKNAALTDNRDNTSGKRNAGIADDSSDDAGPIFSSLGTGSQAKRRKNGHIGGSQDSSARVPQRKQVVTYGSSSQPKRSNDKPKKPTDKKKKSGFKHAKQLPARAEVETPKFHVAKGVDMFAFGKASQSAELEASPSLSSLSSPADSSELEEIAMFDLAGSGDCKRMAQCDICSEDVDVLLKQEYEEEYLQGRSWKYSRQQEFCRYHRQVRAKELWLERGYPDLQWEGLEDRLRAQHKRLVNVMEGKMDSIYRRELERQTASGTTKSTTREYNSSSASTVTVGYYGPRGEKAMQDHIIMTFSGRLRELAVNDPLISSAGTSGGVVGFVQKVLVPEMAVGLVMHDLRVTEGKARAILVESKDLGETLNEEQKEFVADDADAGASYGE